MAVTISQSPSLPFDMAYGPNPVTLSGIPTDPQTGVITADKYVLRIYRLGTLIADLRQSPNRQGRAIFDIQNTIQSQVAPSAGNIEQTGYIGNALRTSATESTPYKLEVGYELDGVVFTEPISNINYLDFGGVKEYFEVPFNTNPYLPLVSEDEGCTIVDNQAKVFSDLKAYRLGGSITDGKPEVMNNDERVYDHYVTRDDMTTISYYNGLDIDGSTIDQRVQGIEAFVFYQYNGNSEVDINPLYNIQANGGGPNTQVGDGIQPNYPYRAITIGTGPKNFQDFDPEATHYYVKTGVYQVNTCESDIDFVTDETLHDWHRFNIVDANCNDFEHYQFSWLNSYGFRDYYTFKKRKDRRVRIKRNEFLQETADYNANSYNVDTYNRGTTVYSQQIQETFTAYTDYISDADAKYLEGLFISADVKVRFNDNVDPTAWFPISLQSSSYTEKTSRKDQLFQYDIKFKLANNKKSQRG